MRSGARALAALLVVGAAASSGLVAVDPAAAVSAPSGGCWSYTPSAAALDAPPVSDISTQLDPWTTVADGGFLLTSSGATATGGTRSATATITSGPVISATDDVTGTASVLLSVDEVPLAAPVQVAFSAKAGTPVTDLVAKADDIPLTSAGAHRIRLDAVYFDVPAESLRVACNGQQTGSLSPGGPNPATAPKPTDVTTDFTVAASSAVTITSVADQAVLDTARPGDVVTVNLAGLASSAPATLQLCSAAGTCLAVGSVTTAADGSATTSFMVPGPAPVGAGSLRVEDGKTTITTGLAVLGVQLVAAAEALDTESTIVTLTGTGWDPKRDVTIRGYAGTNSSTAPTSDAAVVAAVGATGEFTAKFVVADEDTESVIVDQARSSSHIGAVYLISGVIGGATVDPDPTDDRTPTRRRPTTFRSRDPATDPATVPVAPPAVVAPPVVPPADIPMPQDIPVAQPPATTPDGTAAVEDLSVTEAHLAGEPTLSELFGGSPKRDLVFLVENVGDGTVEDPIVRVSVGRSEDIEPQVVDVEVGVLDPGEQTVVTVPLELPMAAFGQYHVVGQVGETELGAFALEWTTYPWGLFALNALALLLLGWGVRHRIVLRRAAGAAALARTGDADAVVDLAAADAWWAYRTGTGPRPVARVSAAVVAGAAVPAAPHHDEPQPGEAIVDLDAAEKWWQRRAGKDNSRAS